MHLRTKVTKGTKGAGSQAAALAVVFKLIESVQARRRAVNTPHPVVLVRAGARFERGRLVERSEAHAASTTSTDLDLRLVRSMSSHAV